MVNHDTRYEQSSRYVCLLIYRPALLYTHTQMKWRLHGRIFCTSLGVCGLMKRGRVEGTTHLSILSSSLCSPSARLSNPMTSCSKPPALCSLHSYTGGKTGDLTRPSAQPRLYVRLCPRSYLKPTAGCSPSLPPPKHRLLFYTFPNCRI